MKKIIPILLLCFKIHAQSDTIYIVKMVDDMTDKIYYSVSHKLILASDDKKKGIIVRPFIEKDLSVKSLYVKNVGVGNCNENDELIILFEDGEKFTIKSFNKFNCDGEGFYDLSTELIKKLPTSKISKIRYTNGISFESYTGELQEDKKEYFMKIFKSLNEKDIRQAKK